MAPVSHNLDLSAIPDLVEAARRVGVPLDGHTIGMIGEAYAAELLNLTLMKASNEGFDALTTDGRTVEVKATTGRAVSLQAHGRRPELLVVLQLNRATLEPTVAYFGPAAPVWEIAGRAQKNGQRRVSIARLPKPGTAGS